MIYILNSLQGLLHYFQLVEGCLELIRAHESTVNFTYDYILRTRVDTYWSSPLPSSSFTTSPSLYTVPEGSRYGGLNDRFGIGSHEASIPALSRLSLLPLLDSSNYRNLNSESSFLAQLRVSNVTYQEIKLPFCVVSYRKYGFPPGRYGVPVARLGSKGMLSGAKCRPCNARCKGECVEGVMMILEKGWSWFDNGEDGVELCDASGDWEEGWEEVYDAAVAGTEFGERRRRGVEGVDLGRCVEEWERFRRKVLKWDVPDVGVVCRLGIESSS